MGGGDGGASRKLKKAAKKIFVHTCGSRCHGQQDRLRNSPATSECSDSPIYSSYPLENQMRNFICKKMSKITNPSNNSPNKNLCTICLDPLNYSSGGSPGQAIFTAQCSHAFHFACISSNVRHGSITCPVCRAHWTQLPRHLTIPFSLPSSETDPVLRILDDSIATSRIHRRSFLRSARYNDDEPIEPEPSSRAPHRARARAQAQVVVDLEEKCDASLSGGDGVGGIEGRVSSVESCDYHDPFMARRWAKHLHGYRF